MPLHYGNAASPEIIFETITLSVSKWVHKKSMGAILFFVTDNGLMTPYREIYLGQNWFGLLKDCNVKLFNLLWRNDTKL